MAPARFERPLGLTEQIFWTTDRWATRHFVLVGEIAGRVNSSALARLLAAAQQRHPVLKAAIQTNADGVPCFVPADPAPIPLRLITAGEPGGLSDHVADELRQPFNAECAPLVRATLIAGDSSCHVLITMHHAIGDGLSAAFIMGEIASGLTGASDPPRLAVRPPVEALLGVLCAPVPVPPLDASDDRDARVSRHLAAGSLNPDELSRLKARCRAEQTTVHGALCAASTRAILATRTLSSPVRCLSPISLRRLFPEVSRDTGVFMTVEKTPPENAGAPFWDVARRALAPLEAAMNPSAAAARAALHTMLLRQRRTPRRVCEALHRLVDYHIVVSNLGVIGDTEAPESPRLRALQLFLNAEAEPSIATATLGGRMALTISCYEPADAVLEYALDVLRTA